jgi:hypothetical protein
VRNNVAQETKCSPKPSGKKERQKDRKKDRTRERDEATAATCECTLDNDRFVGENGSRARWQNRECEKRKMKKKCFSVQSGAGRERRRPKRKRRIRVERETKVGGKTLQQFPLLCAFQENSFFFPKETLTIVNFCDLF